MLDIVGAINQQDDHEKNRNYWKYLKVKLRKGQPEVVSDTTQLKLVCRSLDICILMLAMADDSWDGYGRIILSPITVGVMVQACVSALWDYMLRRWMKR